jgi:hypothetical protein
LRQCKNENDRDEHPGRCGSNPIMRSSIDLWLS